MKLSTNENFLVYREIGDYSIYWNKISGLYNNDDNEIIKMGKVDCQFNPETCRKFHIHELLSLRFFALEDSDFDYKPIAEYLNNTIQETLDTHFSAQVKSTKLRSGVHFVKFFVPYCRACKKIAEAWKQLEDAYANRTDVTVFEVNCRQHADLCDDFDIEKYPSLIWVENGQRIEKFGGHRSFEDFSEYIEEMLSSRPTIETTTTPPHVTDERLITNVSDHEFKSFIAKDFTFVKFFLRKCSHCQEVNALWIELAERFHNHENITIAQVDCSKNYDLCMEDADGCPTLNVYDNGVLMNRDYHEDLTLDGLTDCIVSYMRGGEGKISFLPVKFSFLESVFCCANLELYVFELLQPFKKRIFLLGPNLISKN